MKFSELMRTETTIDEVKDWFKTKMSKCYNVSDGYSNYGCRHISDNYDTTPLEYFREKGKYDIVEYFIKMGAEFNEEDLLNISDINFIKLHCKFENFRTGYVKNPIILNYLLENYIDQSAKFNLQLLINLTNTTEKYKFFSKIKSILLTLAPEETILILENIYSSVILPDDEENQLKIIKEYISDFQIPQSKIMSKFLNIFIWRLANNSRISSIPPATEMSNNDKILMKMLDIAIDLKAIDLNLMQNPCATPVFISGLQMNFPIHMLKKMMDLNYDVNTVVNQTNSLFYCINAEQTKFLLDNGVNVNFVGINDTTPLFNVKEVAQVKILIDAGVDPLIKNKASVKNAYETFMQNANNYKKYNDEKYVKLYNYYKEIADEIYKYMPKNKLPELETKAFDLTKEELIALLENKGFNVDICDVK